MLSHFNKINRIFRVSDWYYLLGIVGYAHLNLSSEPTIYSSSLSLLYAVLYLSSGYTMNNFFDVSEDRDAKNYFKNHFNATTQLFIFLITNIIFISFSIYFDLFWPAAGLFAVNYFYSAKKFRLKNNVFYSIFANVLFFSYIYVASIQIIDPRTPFREMPHLWFIAFMFFHLQYLHHLEHLEVIGEPPSVRKNMSFGLSIFPLILYLVLSSQFDTYEKIIFSGYSAAALGIVSRSASYSIARVRVRYLALAIGACHFFALLYYKIVNHS